MVLLQGQARSVQYVLTEAAKLETTLAHGPTIAGVRPILMELIHA